MGHLIIGTRLIQWAQVFLLESTHAHRMNMFMLVRSKNVCTCVWGWLRFRKGMRCGGCWEWVRFIWKWDWGMFQYQLPIRTHTETHKPSTYCNEVNSTKTNMKELKWNTGTHDQNAGAILRQEHTHAHSTYNTPFIHWDPPLPHPYQSQNTMKQNWVIVWAPSLSPALSHTGIQGIVKCIF